MAQQVRVVALLPDEHEVRRGHELGDERATGGGARKRIGAHAVPAGMLLAVVAGPDLLVYLGSGRLDDSRMPELELLPRHGPKGSYTRRTSTGADR